MLAHSPWWQRIACCALIALTLLPARAEDDPPGRVGRIAEVQGQVWLYDLESGDWIAAARNRPLTTGDRVATDGDGRAEIRIGSSTIRLAAGSEIDIQRLDDEQVKVQLHSGRLALRLRAHEVAREFELVTDEGRFLPDRAGRYRLDRIDATSSVTVWSGQLQFLAPDNAVTVVAGQRAEINHLSGRTQYALLQPQRDAFADEVAAAEAAAERSVATTRYVSPEMTGAEALDSHGRWVEDVEQGALWVPRAVPPGWAPYRFGRWVFIRPWGWTWVDDAPWGFAPFHFGRWVFWRNNWCWAPGRWVARPVFAPALVVWVGAPVFGVAVGVGPSVGWFPLGPREVFVPAYRVSPRYVRNVNVTHVTNITNVTQIVNSPGAVVQQTNYIHRGAPHAVTVVPTTVVSGRQPVAPARVQLTDPHPAKPDERKLALSAQAPVSVAPPLPTPPVAATAPPARARVTTTPVPPPAAGPAPLPAATLAPATPAAPPRAVTAPPAQPAVVSPKPAPMPMPPAVVAPPSVRPPPPPVVPAVPAPRPPALAPQPPAPTAPAAKPQPAPVPRPPVTAPPAAAPAAPAVAPVQPPPGAAPAATAATRPAPPPRPTVAVEPRESSSPKAERR